MEAETISITLPAEIVRAIRAKVEAGAYSSADDVIEEALRQWQADEREFPDVTDGISERIRQSFAEPGPDTPMEEVFADLHRRLRQPR
jgi:antitoxin ParD1/3/4